MEKRSRNTLIIIITSVVGLKKKKKRSMQNSSKTVKPRVLAETGGEEEGRSVFITFTETLAQQCELEAQ